MHLCKKKNGSAKYRLNIVQPPGSSYVSDDKFMELELNLLHFKSVLNLYLLVM